jgi:hypothetical protein
MWKFYVSFYDLVSMHRPMDRFFFFKFDICRLSLKVIDYSDFQPFCSIVL